MANLVNPKTHSIWRTTAREGLEPIVNFSWEKAIDEMKSVCPTLLSSLMAAGSKTDELKRKRGPNTFSVLPNLGCILGLLVFAQKPMTMKFLQEVIGVQLWLSGTAKEVYIVV